jgi:hypothetical protein
MKSQQVKAAKKRTFWSKQTTWVQGEIPWVWGVNKEKEKNWAKSPKAPSPGPVGLIRFGHQQGPSPIAVIPKLHRKYGESDKILRRN